MNPSSFSGKSAREAMQPPAERLDLLPRYSRALEMIERAARVDEAKAIRDMAELCPRDRSAQPGHGISRERDSDARQAQGRPTHNRREV